jgi:dihydrodipicolinate synthase/N-acetylneuraminate lyase
MIAYERWISFANTRFILYDNRHKTEHVISLEQVRKLVKEQNITLTRTAQDELEEIEAQDWYDHYVGDHEGGAWEKG